MGFVEINLMHWSNNLALALIAWILSIAAGFIFLTILSLIAIYVYVALAWSTIAKKLKYSRPWLAWIPFANLAMILQLGGFHWAWIFLILIPFFGWVAFFVIIILSIWRVYERRKYPGALSLICLAQFIPFLWFIATIANLIILGIIAWNDQK